MNISILRKPIVAITCLVAAASANGATITPTYDSAVDQKYWSPDIRKKVDAACKIMGDFIADDITVEIKMTVGAAAGAGATGAITGSSVDTSTKYLASSGTIELNKDSFDETTKSWPQAGIALIVHEIIHCLGFNDKVKAFKANIDTSNNTFKGENVKAMNNGSAFPLDAGDPGHFLTGAVDVRGLPPRMVGGGGSFLSCIDLAALQDIGYNIRNFRRDNTKPAVILNGVLAESYKGTYTQYGAANYVNGTKASDWISNRFSPSSRILLQGFGGADNLIATDPATETVMVGDDPKEVEKGNDNPDVYAILNANCVAVLVGVGNNDRIFLPIELTPISNGTGENPMANASADNVVTVDKMPTGTEAERKLDASLGGYDFGTRSPDGRIVYHIPFKVTITRVEYNGTYSIVNSKRRFTRATENAEKSRNVVLTFYCYAKANTKLEDLKAHLQSKISYMITGGGYRGVYEPTR